MSPVVGSAKMFKLIVIWGATKKEELVWTSSSSLSSNQIFSHLFRVLFLNFTFHSTLSKTVLSVILILSCLSLPLRTKSLKVSPFFLVLALCSLTILRIRGSLYGSRGASVVFQLKNNARKSKLSNHPHKRRRQWFTWFGQKPTSMDNTDKIFTKSEKGNTMETHHSHSSLSLPLTIQ